MRPLTAFANALTSGFGNDTPESQCEAIVQALTGIGRDLNTDLDFLDVGEIVPMNMNYAVGRPTVLFHFTFPPVFHNFPVQEPGYPGPGLIAADWPDVLNAVAKHPNQVLYFGLVIGPLRGGWIDPQTGRLYVEPRGGDTDPVTLLAEITGGAVLDVGEDLSGLTDAIDEALDLIPGSIPTVSEWGLVVLALLLLTGITIKFGRRRLAQA